MQKLLFLPLFAPEERPSVGPPHPEIGPQPPHRIFQADIDVAAHGLRGAIGITANEGFDQFLMSRRLFIKRPRPCDAEPRRRESVYFLDRRAQGSTSRSRGNLAMQFLVNGQV